MPKGVYERKKHAEATALRVAIDVPEAGVELKLTSANKMLGTLLIDRHGLRWAKSNQKRKPDRVVSYAILTRLMALGIG